MTDYGTIAFDARYSHSRDLGHCRGFHFWTKGDRLYGQQIGHDVNSNEAAGLEWWLPRGDQLTGDVIHQTCRLMRVDSIS